MFCGAEAEGRGEGSTSQPQPHTRGKPKFCLQADFPFWSTVFRISCWVPVKSQMKEQSFPRELPYRTLDTHSGIKDRKRWSEFWTLELGGQANLGAQKCVKLVFKNNHLGFMEVTLP